MRRLLALCLWIASVPTFAFGQEPQSATTPAAQNWMKGLAPHLKRLAKLTEQLKHSGPNGKKGTPFSLSCPAALESALIVALTEAHFKNGENEDFHLIFNGPKDDALDISYTYNKRGALVMTGIYRLPSDWQIGFQPGEANVNKFVVIAAPSGQGCVFEFSTDDPFASKAFVKPAE